MGSRAEAVDELPGFITGRKSRSEKRREKQASYKEDEFQLKKIKPLTENQNITFDAFYQGKNLLLHGVAGTGKTFIAMSLSLESVMSGESPKPIVVIRSVVPSRDMGFLPGTNAEKSAVYEEPYKAICTELTGKANAYERMKSEGFIQFSTTSFLRGLTFRDNIIIVDECQNMSFAELDTIMTRVGEGCRVIFCGDFRQTDLQREEEKRGLNKFMSIVRDMNSFEFVEFSEKDIVRSGLVREYLLAKLDKNIT